MASYVELRSLFNESDLRNRLEVAAMIASVAIQNEPANTANHANRLIWAKNALNNTTSVAEGLLKYLLADNSGLTVAQITGASDAELQTAVDAAVNLFADGS